MPKALPAGLYVISDTTISARTPEDMVHAALGAGARWVQYREKNRTRREIHEVACRLRGMTSRFGARFIVNDHADIALAVGADGVHLGQDDLPLPEARKIMGDRVVGISTHCLEEALEAAAGGADYIGFGPVFRTATKDAGEPKGVELLRRIREKVHIPVVAIGGISRENVTTVCEAGADAVAVASAILVGDIAQNVSMFIERMQGGN